MMAYILRRLFWFIPVFFVVTALTFWTVRALPGGPFDFAGDKELPEYVVRNIERKYGLDKPIWQQYLNYLGDLVRLDFGVSYKYRDRDVSQVLGIKFLTIERSKVELQLQLTDGSLVVTDPGIDKEFLLEEGKSVPLRDGTSVRYGKGMVIVEKRTDILLDLPIRVLSQEDRLMEVQVDDEWVPLHEGAEVTLPDGTELVSEDGEVRAQHGSARLVLGWSKQGRLAMLEGSEATELKTNVRVELSKTEYITVDSKRIVMQERLDLPIKFMLHPQESGGWALSAPGAEEPQLLLDGKEIDLPGDLSVAWDESEGTFEAEIYRRTVEAKVGLPISAALGLFSMGIALLLGIPLGILAALRHNTIIDYVATFFAILGVSVPNMVLGPLLILLFVHQLDLLDLSWQGRFSNYILPAIALGTGMAASIARLTRASLLQVIREDYIRTAQAKGLSARTVVVRHALKNSLIPVVTILGPMFAAIVTGTLVIEQIFAIPGMGKHFVTSIGNRDYPVLMAVTIIYAVLIVLANLVVDITYGILDPRIRYK
ncbi:MAG: ABC transporter permease [Chloroflexia bacterium]|nr:ABC transporter permease [Chloroflexia bacterium]